MERVCEKQMHLFNYYQKLFSSFIRNNKVYKLYIYKVNIRRSYFTICCLFFQCTFHIVEVFLPIYLPNRYIVFHWICFINQIFNAVAKCMGQTTSKEEKFVLYMRLVPAHLSGMWWWRTSEDKGIKGKLFAF